MTKFSLYIYNNIRFQQSPSYLRQRLPLDKHGLISESRKNEHKRKKNDNNKEQPERESIPHHTNRGRGT